MALARLIVCLGLIVPLLPATAAVAGKDPRPAASAPAGDADTRYCMRIEAVTGTRLERVKCWTREEWAEQGVDVDEEWSREGVRTVG